ncbi:MAG: metal ABC transporter solute-binding protein, Zn/Mn family [Gammaproteobacteria bacterium]
MSKIYTGSTPNSSLLTIRFIQVLTIFFLFTGCSLSFAEPLNNIQITTSIPPLYNIVQRLVPANFQVSNLIGPQESPHDFYFKPSHLKLLEKSDLILWIGPNLETGLVKAITKLRTNSVSILSILSTEKNIDIPFLKARHIHFHTQASNTDTHSNFDPHIWLSPKHVQKIAWVISNLLAEKYPRYKPQLLENYENFYMDLEALDFKFKTIGSQIAPYYVYHDAYQYLEYAYQLPSLGPISAHPEIPLSAKQIQHILDQIQKHQARCLFTEPQFNSKILERIQNLFKSYRLEIFEVNPLGKLNQDPIQTIEDVIGQFEKCKRL